MEYLPRLAAVIIVLFFSSGVRAELDCEKVLHEESVSRHFIHKVSLQLDDREEYIQQLKIKPSDIDWSTAKRLERGETWSEYLVHHAGQTFQMKVYYLEFMREPVPGQNPMQADVDQMIVQSALAELGMARPILKIITPLDAGQLGHELRKQGLISAHYQQHIYFAALFPYYDSWNTVIVPEAVDLPLWFDEMGRDVIKGKIVNFERALSRLGILHGARGFFYVYSDGRVELADFDHLRGSGFQPEHAGAPSSIFAKPLAGVREIFDSHPEF